MSRKEKESVVSDVKKMLGKMRPKRIRILTRLHIHTYTYVLYGWRSRQLSGNYNNRCFGGGQSMERLLLSAFIMNYNHY